MLKEIFLGLHSNINQKVISWAFAVLCFQRFLLSVLQLKRSKSRTFFDSLIVILLLFRYFTINDLNLFPVMKKLRRRVRGNIRIFFKLDLRFRHIICYDIMLLLYLFWEDEVSKQIQQYILCAQTLQHAFYAHKLKLYWMSQHFCSLISNTMNNSNVFWSFKK